MARALKKQRQYLEDFKVDSASVVWEDQSWKRLLGRSSTRDLNSHIETMLDSNGRYIAKVVPSPPGTDPVVIAEKGADPPTAAQVVNKIMQVMGIGPPVPPPTAQNLAQNPVAPHPVPCPIEPNLVPRPIESGRVPQPIPPNLVPRPIAPNPLLRPEPGTVSQPFAPTALPVPIHTINQSGMEPSGDHANTGPTQTPGSTSTNEI